MATFKEALTTSLTNFAKSIAKTYPKTANIVDNLLSTDSTLPLSAKQGNVLQTQIDTLNSNMINHQKWAIAAGETRRVLVREAEGIGNLVLFSTYMVIPSYKTIFFASSGNENNINPGQNITITKLLESSDVTVTPVNEDGKYNCFDIKNNGNYNVILHANTLYGTPPIIY